MTSMTKLAMVLSATIVGVAGAAAAGPIQVISAGAEYAALHPRPVEADAATAPPRAEFHATMDRVFGAGRWRQTSGYRTPAQENALRRQGAGVVARGHTSLHSIGAADAPGAYDAVVDRLAPARAAARLRQAGVGFSRVVAEAAHGRQGPHLHVELVSTRSKAAASD